MSNSHNFSAFSSLFKNTTNFATLFSSLVLSVSVLSFNLPKVSVNAGSGPKYMIVTHRNGINIRDKNCKVIDSAGFNEVLEVGSDNPVNITCNVNGKSMIMYNYGIQGSDKSLSYVSSNFVQGVISGGEGVYSSNTKSSLNGKNGVNLRDNNCKRVVTLPKGTYSENGGAGLYVQGVKVCKVGNDFYNMVGFYYKGSSYNVAEILMKFE